MLFEKFFNAISRWLPEQAFVGDLERLELLDPSKIYIENVRAVLNVSRRSAIAICEAAVRQGLFLRGIEAVTEDGVVVASALGDATLPETVEYNEEDDGFAEVVTRPVSELRKITFYRLADEEASEAHGSPA